MGPKLSTEGGETRWFVKHQEPEANCLNSYLLDHLLDLLPESLLSLSELQLPYLWIEYSIYELRAMSST